MKGSAGNDMINSASIDDVKTRDWLYGFAGNDRLFAYDGAHLDVVDGGAGTNDLCITDPGEPTSGCEVH